MEKIYTEKELQTKSINELKKILESRELKKSGYKAQLIKRILDSQGGKQVRKSRKTISRKTESIPEPIIKIGKYLPGGEKYNEAIRIIEYFLNSADDYNYRNGINMRKSLEEYANSLKIMANNIRSNQWTEDMQDKLFDKQLYLYREARKDEYEIMSQLYSYPNPKYYNISTTFDNAYKIETYRGEIMYPSNLEEVLKRVLGINIKLNEGDMVGITIKGFENQYPELLLHVGYVVTYVRKSNENQERINSDKYPLPSGISKGNREEIENIYSFPFVRAKGKEKL